MVASTIGRVSDRGHDLAQRLVLRRPRRPAGAQASAGEHEGDDEHRAEDRLGADRRPASAPSDRAEQRAGDRGAERGADHRAALLLGGSLVISQVSAPDQISAPATPWTKRAASSSRDLLAEAEDEAGAAEQQQAGDHRAPRARPGWRRSRPAARPAASRPRRRRRGSPPPPCSAEVRRRSRAAAARSPRRRRRRRRPSSRRESAGGACSTIQSALQSFTHAFSSIDLRLASTARHRPGGVAERLNAAALKAVRRRKASRGFESHPLRSKRHNPPQIYEYRRQNHAQV